MKRKTFDIFIAPTAQSTEGEIDKFYSTLDDSKAQCKLLEINIVMDDLNVRVGKERDGEIAGKFEQGTRNKFDAK